MPGTHDQIGDRAGSTAQQCRQPTSVRQPTLSALGKFKRRVRRRILLTWPRLYALNRVKYEQSLTADGEIDALLSKLKETLAVPGDVIECGCYLCGSTVRMARLLQQQGSTKRIYACDSFAGFDHSELSEEKRRGNTSDTASEVEFATNDFAYVQQKLKRLGVADEVVLVRGLFQDTLESLKGPFSFAFIDCDLYDSMLYAARLIWPRLSAGACCAFDDYANDEYRGAGNAVTTFLAEQAHSIAQHGPLSVKMYYAFKV